MMGKRVASVIGLMVAFGLIGTGAMGGSLTPPPGPVTSTMKTLDEVEARIPIRTVPMTINQPGSYYLTKNFTVGSGQFGLLVTVPNVSIDLNGFTLSGQAGGAVGITASTPDVGIDISNGTIEGMQGFGIELPNVAGVRIDNMRLLDNQGGGADLGNGCSVTGCDVRENGGPGLRVRAGGSVADSTLAGNRGHGVDANVANVGIRQCQVLSNEQTGLRLGANAHVSGCVVSGNFFNGIIVGTGGSVSDCTVTAQLQSGILAGGGCTITGCTVRQNTLDGICTTGGCTIENCTSSSNGGDGICASGATVVKGCNSLVNGQDGIEVANGGAILDCKACDNSGDGVKVGTNCRVIGNSCSRNGLATMGAAIRVTGTGNHLEGNSMHTNVLGISTLSAGNYIIKNTAVGSTGTGTPSGSYSFGGFQQFFGPVVTVTGAITATNPFTNFQS